MYGMQRQEYGRLFKKIVNKSNIGYTGRRIPFEEINIELHQCRVLRAPYAVSAIGFMLQAYLISLLFESGSKHDNSESEGSREGTGDGCTAEL